MVRIAFGAPSLTLKTLMTDSDAALLHRFDSRRLCQCSASFEWRARSRDQFLRSKDELIVGFSAKDGIEASLGEPGQLE